MQKEWLLKQNNLDSLSELNTPDFIKNILINRGIKTKKDAEEFLNPDYSKLNNPFEMLNMERAARRVITAIKNNEKIIIFGDYDADGICGSAVFYSFLKEINYNNFEVYIPNRYEEGYGLNTDAINEFKNKNVSLIITTDCGIRDREETTLAKNFGIDIIITDHHLPIGELPDAYAIINPHQPDDKYPFKGLCGAAVAFKIISAVLKIENFGLVGGWEKWLLDIVTIATVADMMPLTGENRILTAYGLFVLKKTRRLGLTALMNKAKINKTYITAEDISFFLAPRLNAASRMGSANTSFELITSDSEIIAKEIAARLEEKNNERKKMVENVMNEVREKINPPSFAHATEDNSEPEIIILGNISWNSGILGAAASRLMEEYNIPVFLWGKGNAKEIKGSCRSNGMDLTKFIKNINDNIVSEGEEDVFLDFGGHALAAGFSLKEGKTEIFEQAVFRAWQKNKQKKAVRELLIDRELNLEDINNFNFSWLERLEPCGETNQKPVFLFKNLKIENIKAFGNGGIHLELCFKKLSDETIKAIGFFMYNSFARLSTSRKLTHGSLRAMNEAENLEINPSAYLNAGVNLKTDDIIDLAASFDKNYFNGKIELRLKIIDIKII